MNEQRKPLLTTIITHVRPHLDELFAIWLIQRFGHNSWQFRDGEIKVRYVESDKDAKAIATGTSVLVGIGGGRYDEHKGAGRDKRECAASLVAKDLKDDRGRSIEGILEMNHLLREVVKADKGEVKGYFALPTLLNKLQRQHADSRRVLDIAFDFFDACYEDARQFYRECKIDLANGKTCEHGGLFAAAVASDVEAFNAYARTRGRVNVLFQKSSAGNVAVFTDERGAKILPALVRVILREELVRAGKAASYPEAAETVDGIERDNAGRDLPVVSHWYYHVECHMLLNGSKSKPGVTPTALDADAFLRLFQAAVETHEWQEKAKLTLVASA